MDIQICEIPSSIEVDQRQIDELDRISVLWRGCLTGPWQPCLHNSLRIAYAAKMGWFRHKFPACVLVFVCLVVGIDALKHKRPYASRRGPARYDPTHVIQKNGILSDPPLSMCQEFFRDTTLDHFAWDVEGGTMTYPQRYFFCDKFWKEGKDGKKGPIFVYLGNEANVELYVNATGLMWESAVEFGALLLFIEHRYYGESKPYGAAWRSHKAFLTVEQAIADYAETISELKLEYKARDSAVIGFGGSYGGMIGAWMRMKYPHILDGVIAASAPVWSFMGENPPYDPNSFAKGETYDATPEAGSAAECEPNFRKVWPTLTEIGETQEGRDKIVEAMKLCDDLPLEAPEDVWYIVYWVETAVAYMSMGNYPFPSGYMVGGNGELPAFPMRVACAELAEPLEGLELLQAAARAAGIYHNYTGTQECFQLKAAVNEDEAEVEENWGFQYCTEMFQPFGRDGVDDMFWDNAWDPDEAIYWCLEDGLMPRPLWSTVEWGGKNIAAASNIIFSNGEYDPWSGGGVHQNFSNGVYSIEIKEAGHHLDLMFSDPGDTPALLHARAFEKEQMQKWIDEAEEIQLKIQKGAGLDDSDYYHRKELGRQASTQTASIKIS